MEEAEVQVLWKNSSFFRYNILPPLPPVRMGKILYHYHRVLKYRAHNYKSNVKRNNSEPDSLLTLNLETRLQRLKVIGNKKL